MKRPTDGARQEGKKDRISTSIFAFPTRPRQINDLVGLNRQPRSPGEQVRAAAGANRRIALLSEEGRSPILAEELRDLAAWLERGCVPRMDYTA